MLLRIVRRLLLLPVDLYLAGVTGWTLAWQLFHDRWGFLGLLNSLAFWILLPAIPIGTLRLWRRSAPWIAGVWAVVGTLVFSTRFGHVAAWPFDGRSLLPPEAGQRTQLRVFSLNVLRYNDRVQDIMTVISQQSPDVIVMQELAEDIHRQIDAALPAGYTYRDWQPHDRTGGGLAVFSRVPFTVTGVWQIGYARPYALRATLELPQGPVDIYNVHLLAFGGGRPSSARFTNIFRQREEQARTLVAEIAARSNRAMVIGDHNMTEGHHTYRIMAGSLTDAWRAAGRGPGWTWPRTKELFGAADEPFMPFLRLDYAFTHNLLPLRMDVVYDWTGSDHCPLLLTVGI